MNLVQIDKETQDKVDGAASVFKQLRVESDLMSMDDDTNGSFII